MSYIDEIQKRYESEGKGFVRITNKDLVCKDCMYRHDDSVIFGNTSRCDFYPTQKPNAILATEVSRTSFKPRSIFEYCDLSMPI